MTHVFCLNLFIVIFIVPRDIYVHKCVGKDCSAEKYVFYEIYSLQAHAHVIDFSHESNLYFQSVSAALKYRVSYKDSFLLLISACYHFIYVFCLICVNITPILTET